MVMAVNFEQPRRENSYENVSLAQGGTGQGLFPEGETNLINSPDSEKEDSMKKKPIGFPDLQEEKPIGFPDLQKENPTDPYLQG